MASNKIISIEGNIGSGKSSFLSELKNKYKDNSKIIFLDEPLSEWNDICDTNGITILEKFYEDQNKYAFSFQMMAYISRLAKLKEQYKKHSGVTFITERSLHTDKHVFAKMLYDNGSIEKVNYQIYLKWFETFAEDFQITNIVYIKALPEICTERIEKRSRKGEGSISLDYLHLCNRYHNEFVKLFENRTEIDGNVNIYQNPTILEEWLNKVDELV